MAAEKLPVQLACRVLGVSESGYYAWRDRPLSARAVRHAWLTDEIRRVHNESRDTYGALRVHAELTLGRGVVVGHCAVAMLMARAGIAGLSGRPRYRRIPHVATASDLVKRDFSRDESDSLWVTDITEHPTREGKLYCAVVLDACSRKVVGWSIDSNQETSLVISALGMAIQNRTPNEQTVIHSDQGTQFTSWAFTQRVLDAGLLPSMGSVGDCLLTGQYSTSGSSRLVDSVDTGDKRLGRSTAFPSCSRQARHGLLMSHGRRPACRTRGRSVAALR
jgi:putative transposase